MGACQPDVGQHPAQALDEYYGSDHRDVSRRPWLEVCYFAP